MDNKLNEHEQAEQLLMEWYQWTKRWRPALGAPRVSVYCRESRTSRQYEMGVEDDRVYVAEMTAVEWCVNTLPLHLQQSIGTEMRNREVGARVWRGGGSYQEAMTAVISKFKARHLFVCGL